MKWPLFLLKCSADLWPFDRTVILRCDLENNIDCGTFAILSLVIELEVDEWCSLERKHMLATANREFSSSETLVLGLDFCWHVWHYDDYCFSFQLLHICIEGWGNWRWSEPFSVDHAGTFIRTIQYKGRTASLIIKVHPLSGVQKQVSFPAFVPRWRCV